MAGRRPEFIDLRSQSQLSLNRPLRSPRLHVAGEVPPELSPLDAFAMQSRLLARQLQEESKAGNRLSRLPPLTIESPLIVQGRSDYFRSMSYESGSDNGESPIPHSAPNTGLGLRTEIEDAGPRPMSMHPRMSRVPPTPDEPVPIPQYNYKEAFQARQQLANIGENNHYFGGRREQSPPPLERSVTSSSLEQKGSDGAGSRSNPQDALHPYPSPAQSYSAAGSPEKMTKQNSFDSAGLVPPPSLFPKRSSSIMSSPVITDEEGSSSLSASFYSQPSRKLSTTSSSGMMSPGFPPHRAPSAASDHSALPRPSFNFSRPMSRIGTPGLDTPARQTSSDSHASFILTDDTANTPVSMNGEGFPDSLGEDGTPVAPYVYSTYSLPRGKAMQRELEDAQQAGLSPEKPVASVAGQPPPSPPTRPSSSAGPAPRFLEEPVPRPSIERSKLSSEMLHNGQALSPVVSKTSTEGSRISEDVPRGRPIMSPLFDPTARGRTATSTTTSDSASTIKPAHSVISNTISNTLSQTVSNASQAPPSNTEISPEEHVTKAIALHEQGILNESTYHLRRAAKQGNPTGMLLYALACRHGWGMRPNQQEGVQWLRKAAESASLEIADEEEHIKEGKAVDHLERKTRKAQFALSIYELGVSHMNGWGIEQDKALALRCFEIAGCMSFSSVLSVQGPLLTFYAAWGDVDALAEAGFCYAQGIGCRKNLKKAAGFYRQAEAKGMSMVGNSWYVLDLVIRYRFS